MKSLGVERFRSAVVVFLFALLWITGATAPALAQDCSQPWINEFDYDDNTSGLNNDRDEFVEIAARAGTDLSYYQIFAVEGNVSCWTGFFGANGEAYFGGFVPPGTIVGDDTGTGVGFLVVCFTYTSANLSADCDVVITGIAQDSNLKNGHLLNANTWECPDGVLLLDPSSNLVDAISWEGVIPNVGTYGHYFNPPNVSYNVGVDHGYSLGNSFQKRSAAGRAVDASEWWLRGVATRTPGAANYAQSLACAPPVVCGDGDLGEGEDCDDGNTADGDCCSSTCSYEVSGSICDDSEICTDGDSCDGAGTCAGGTPLACSNGQFCDGVEFCQSGVGCQPGTPPVPDDGISCTIDTCDEVADSFVFTPDHAACDDQLFCNGPEVCDPVSNCILGPGLDLDDGVACTVDICNESADQIQHFANHAFCDDQLFCNGNEVCDLVNDCQLGSPLDPSDGVACTVDICNESTDQVQHFPNHASCDNGLFCDGDEICDAVSDCQPGTAPTADDGVGCTTDSCDEAADAIVNTPDDGACDNGLFCDGPEICDAASDCLAGTPPLTDDGIVCTTGDICDEVADVVAGTPDAALCDDANPCTADSCDALAGCGNAWIPGCSLDPRNFEEVPGLAGCGHTALALLLVAAGSALSTRRRGFEV